MIVLLTGAIGAGKTTVAERLAGLARQRGITCGGLLARPLRNSSGHKVGIWGIDLLAGRWRPLARIGRDLGGPAVGPYSFDVAALAWAIGVLQAAPGRCDLVVVDEIGRLELHADQGLAPVLPCLAAGGDQHWLVLVREALLAELQSRLGSLPQAVFTVTLDNRDALPGEILTFLFGQAAP